jgi:hypothetical protein
MKVLVTRNIIRSVSLALLAMAFALSMQAKGASAVPNLSVTTTASQVTVAYYDGPEPHYGAFFNRAGGYNQNYLGPGGFSITCGSSSGCISNWTWWPNIPGGRNVLLLPKRGWLFPYPGYQIVVYDPWQPYNYQATFPF